MGKKTHRRWLLAAAILLAVVAAWLLYRIGRSPQRDDLSTYWGFVLAVAIAVIGLLRAWMKDPGPPGEKELAQAMDRLAIDVAGAWEPAAEERGLTGNPIQITWHALNTETVSPTGAILTSTRFDPLPGLTAVQEEDLRGGKAADLHSLYGGLRSGRLIITGPAGSGKSGAAIQLLLAALRHRDQVTQDERPHVPVPVLFTVRDWEPHESAEDWLIRKIHGTYHESFASADGGAATIRALLSARRIMVLLDGLDEIVPERRPDVLRALDQATFRLVLLSRTDESARPDSDWSALQGAATIWLERVDTEQAVSYLTNNRSGAPPDAWRDLIEQIRNNPGSSLSKTLNNPLTLTLVRTIARGGDLRELLEFCRDEPPAGDIRNRILDKFLPAVYASHPGKPLPYNLDTAQHTLAKIATQMNQDGKNRDLDWWQITAWVPPVSHVMICFMTGSIAAGLTGGFLYGLTGVPLPRLRQAGPLYLLFPSGEPWAGLVYGLFLGAVIGLTIGLSSGLAHRAAARGDIYFSRSGSPIWKIPRATLNSALIAGLTNGILFGVLDGLAGGSRYGLAGGLSFLIVTVGVNIGLIHWISRTRASQRMPRILGDVRLLAALSKKNLSAAIGVGIINGIPGGLAVEVASGPTVGIVFGLELGIMAMTLIIILNSTRATPESKRSLSPATSQRANRNYGLSAGLATGLSVGLIVGIPDAAAYNPAAGLAAGLVAAVTLGTIVTLLTIKSYPVALAALELAFMWGTPPRLMRFLEDAHGRGVLRSVGPTYQFRHADLQDRLAELAGSHSQPASASIRR